MITYYVIVQFSSSQKSSVKKIVPLRPRAVVVSVYYVTEY